MAHKRSQPGTTPSRSSLRLKEGASNGAETPDFICNMEHAKRQRTHRGAPSRDVSSQPHLRAASELDSHFPGCTSDYRSSFAESSEMFTLPQETFTDFPRVASSAHINELVAKYSTPYSLHQEQDTWFQRTGGLPGFSNPGGMHSLQTPPELLEAKVSDVTSQEFHVAFNIPESDARGLSKELSTGLREQAPDDEVRSPKSKDTFFEDLALMAANADIPRMQAEEEVVGGLSLGEDTRHTVEQWLRDSPVAAHGVGLTALVPEGDAAEEGERSLPQWVLEELGEGSQPVCVQVEVKPQGLVRADSNGSSTNVPSFSLKGDVWEVDQDGVSNKRRRETTEYVNLKVEDGPEARNTLDFEEDISVQSCAAGEETVADCADSLAVFGPDAVAHMSRSFSTTWMTDLLQDCDTFEGGLGTFHHAGGVSCNGDDGGADIVRSGWECEDALL